MPTGDLRGGTDFIRNKVARDLETGKYDGRVVTRFPPEPNGFLHIGHAKAICLNFGLAEEHPGGRCHLRLDDTNPDTEKVEYVEAMKRDIRWLGFDWGEHLYYASDYFGQLFQYALVLIDKGLAYVDSSTEDEIRERRGSVTEAGTDSPWRDRSLAENRDLFLRMKEGEFEDGAHVLRARIDMAHPNMVMRDPILYRIRHAHHYRQGDEWSIYPLYDFAHCLSDSIERVTHSLCTLEFENNREIYDWLLANVDAPTPRPEQTEFAPLVLDYVVTSKRRLRPLVEEGRVRGWDDPRMSTLAGLRRRGVTPDAIRALCDMVGVAKAHSRIDMGKFEFVIRDDLNYKAERAFCVLDPLRVVLTNYPEGDEERFEAPSFPPDVGKPGTRELPFGRVVYIDRRDFREDPPPGYRRLTPGGEVRLKYAFVIRCDDVVKDPDTGEIVELRCTVDPDTRGGRTPPDRRVRGTIQWVSAAHAVPAEVRLYDRLFGIPDPLSVEDFREALNPDSEVVVETALVEPGIADTAPGTRYQFERLGYFFSDPEDSAAGSLVFNRTVTLRDTWARAMREAPTSKEESPSRAASTKAPDGAPGDFLRSEEDRARFDALVADGVSNAVAASLVRSTALLDLYTAARRDYPSGTGTLASWISNEVARLAGDDAGIGGLTADALAHLVRTVDEGELSHRQGRTVLSALMAEGGSVESARAGLDLTEIDDDAALRTLIEGIVAEFPEKAAAFRGGQQGLLGFFVGEVMKRSGGKANPRKTSALASEILTS